ncbi:acetate--CoA ligase family protein [Belnapia moabensis]|uniref:acetate--CoA ligase family protein n=1 Tax=Belnapia moabensis TaxID=365533 RepID=UPI000AA23A2D|nr:acetate--CoA ligase family protein [Belnapia moabensis]
MAYPDAARPAAPSLPFPHDPGIAALLHPRAVALLGATDRSRWSAMTFQNLTGFGYGGEVLLVNRRGGIVHGRSAAERCTALATPPELGIVMVPMAAVEEALLDLAAAGGRAAVILTSGFAEAGESGAAAQARLGVLARENGLRLLGPNCLGLINHLDRVPVWTAPLAAGAPPGAVAAISQSGQVGHHLNTLGRQLGSGLSHLVTTGNEVDLDFADFAAAFVADERVRAIALFLETIRHPERFTALARQAFAAGKPIVVCKIGASEAAAQSARAHTGALVGDDRVFDGVCRQYGVVRVSSMEDLVTTATLLARTGVLREGGLGIMSNSGGICGLAADTAVAAGMTVPPLSPDGAMALRDLLPDYGTPQNPLDITGASTLDRSLFGSTLTVMAREPGLAALVTFADLPDLERDAADPLNRAGWQHMADALAEAPIPSVLLSCLGRPASPVAQGIAEELRLPYLAAGLQRGMAALGGAFWWSARQRRGLADAAPRPASPGTPPRPRSEAEALDWLSRCGVPVVPMTLARDEATAVAAAARIGGPVVLKLASAQVAHKSDIGGVALNLEGEAAVRRGFHAVQARVPADASVDGVLVAPMRRGGVELLVGVTCDAQWGPVLALGLGGVWVEVLRDVALRPLPLAQTEVRAMLEELRGGALLRGGRGVPAADLDRVAEVVACIGDAALALGPALETLEVNPLWVRGGEVEALDALAIWRET